MNGGADEDVTNVTGLGVADGTVLFLNGAASTNTLNYDAGGETPTITPGLLPGEVLITIPGAGIVDAINYQVINITDVGPLVITPGPAVDDQHRRGLPERQCDRRHLHRADRDSCRHRPASPPATSPRRSTGATRRRDPSAGTITQDASNPSIYYITGTHTFVDTGTFTVDNTVAFAGGTISVPIGGVPISFTFGPAGPTAGTPATATVTQGPLAVSAFPIVGTEGIAIPSAPIATFIDSGGADPIGDYSATIDVFDSLGNHVASVAAASITQNADAAQFTVVAPDLLLLEEGTYQVVVSVTDDGGADPITVSGASSAVIADAPLTAGAASRSSLQIPASPLAGYRRRQLHRRQSGRRPPHDFTATIDWGDGSPQQRRPSSLPAADPARSTSPATTPTPSPASTPSPPTSSTMAAKRPRSPRRSRSPISRVTGAVQQLHGHRGPGHRHDRAGNLQDAQHAGAHVANVTATLAYRRLGRHHADPRPSPWLFSRSAPIRPTGRADLRGPGQPHLRRGRHALPSISASPPPVA